MIGCSILSNSVTLVLRTMSNVGGCRKSPRGWPVDNDASRGGHRACAFWASVLSSSVHFWVKRVKAKGRGREAETWTAALTRRRSARWMPRRWLSRRTSSFACTRIRSVNVPPSARALPRRRRGSTSPIGLKCSCAAPPRRTGAWLRACRYLGRRPWISVARTATPPRSWPKPRARSRCWA